MKLHKLLHTLMLLAALSVAPAVSAGEPPVDARARLALIPAPAAIALRGGTFELRADTPLVAADEDAAQVARQFAESLQRTRAIALQVHPTSDSDVSAVEFRLESVAAGASPESYSLDVSPRRVVVRAGDPRGLFYGAVTLWQLATAGDRGAGAAVATIPALHIDDAPRFGWRGLMLDSARHFQSVEEVKRLLDAMALHKLNVFHWHLTDDQGWRLPVRKYPELTRVGACRIPAGDGGIDPRTGAERPYCGFYTREQIGEVLAHAAARHITVVPEVELPGHAQAAVAAYPAFGSVDEPARVSADWGVHPYLFNAEEDTFRFLEDVLAEVVDLFPGRYVHIGGDEAFKRQWQQSPRIQARMRALGVADEEQLQAYFVHRMERFLAAHGRRLIGWDEILEGGELPPDATVMSWRGIEGGVTAARKGHDVVMSPVSPLYLDYLQTDSPDEPPGRPATNTLREVYDFEPVPDALTPEQARHILGLQANVWTEHMRTFDRVQHAIFPRIAAVAETGWTPRARKDWDGFLARLPAQLRRYDALGIGYARTPFAVRIEGAARDRDRVEVSLSTPLGLGTIRYTSDGSAPTAASPRYERPLSLPLPAQVSAAAFVDGAPLVDARNRRFDAASLLRREDEALAMCSEGLMLRLEDDGPLEGQRAIYNADIFRPCWLWQDAPLDGIATIEVRAGHIPYYFQLAGDESHRTFRPARSAYGELEIRARCDGDLLASVPLPAAPGRDGFATLRAQLPPDTRGDADLCFTFTGDTRPAMWVLDRVTLVPAAR